MNRPLFGIANRNLRLTPRITCGPRRARALPVALRAGRETEPSKARDRPARQVDALVRPLVYQGGSKLLCRYASQAQLHSETSRSAPCLWTTNVPPAPHIEPQW